MSQILYLKDGDSHSEYSFYSGFSNIMRDNMLVNVSGNPGHAMGIDLNIEHLIGYLKVSLFYIRILKE